MTNVQQLGDCIAFSVVIAIITAAYIRSNIPEEKPKKQTYEYVTSYRRKKK